MTVTDHSRPAWRHRLAHRRLVDRIRPWAAPRPERNAPEVAVIGAGAAGLATATLLRRGGVRAIVFDGADDVGGAWPSRYDSLRLNTVRWMSDLPGSRMPRRLGRWVDRDDVADYLRSYAGHHALDVELGPNARVDTIRRDGTRWMLTFAGGTVREFTGVVVATGHARRPVVPQWPGTPDFDGRVIHAHEYTNPLAHEGRRVLVVGAGSSGGEICVDLAGAGIDVAWAVRTAPRVFPREAHGVPLTPFAPLADALADPLLDRLAPWLERSIYGRRDYLPEPDEPMMRLLARRCKEPLTADGIVELVRAGDVTVVDAVDDLVANGARLADRTIVEADDVVAATGYASGLEPLVGGLGVLDADGRPVTLVAHDTLGFVGYRIPFTGTLWAIEQDARHVAATITANVRRARRGPRAAP